MKLIGRMVERRKLERILGSKNPEFLALYGRRRVGKTFLIREFFKSRGVFFEVAGQKDAGLKEQLDNFLTSVNETFHPALPIRPPASWKEAFSILTTLTESGPTNRKTILFFDELPWLSSKRSGLLQALDYFWNQKWSRNPNLIVIVCGSAASWMLDNLVHAKGGLYNRLTQIIQLRPFTLRETREFLVSNGIKLNDSQVLELYMVFGGIPHYLRFMEKGKSAAQIINDLCFRKDSLFFKEFHLLFQSLFEHAETHMEIIRAIAQKRYGISRDDLLKATGMTSGGTFKKRLDELESACFIERFVPYGKRKKDFHVKIIDEYTLFYLHWMEKINESLPSAAIKNNWLSLRKDAENKAWTGLAFEAVCHKHANQIVNALNLNSLVREIGCWRHVPGKNEPGTGAQIDFLIDRTDSSVTLCEIKHSEKVFAIDKAYAKNLANKINVFERMTKTRKQVFLAFISTHGLKRNVWSEDLIHGEATLADLFQP